MKRHHLFFLVLIATLVAIAFGASSALAATLKFEPKTGVLTYETLPGDSVGLDDVNKVWVDKATTWGTVEIGDENTAADWFPQGVTLWIDPEAAKVCFFLDGGKHSRFAWGCQASKVVVKTGLGNDDIEVSNDLKLPTQLEGGPGIDWIQGGGGNDEIWGGCAGLNPNCNGFKDTLHGGDGDDWLHGGASFDYLTGDAGNDLIDGAGSGDNLYGGDGRDLADYSSRTVPIVASLNGVADDGNVGENDFIASDVEGIQGGSGKDTLLGNDSLNILKGGPNDDSLDAYGGPDLLMGEGGKDLLRPGFGTDNVYGGSDPDTVTYSERSNPLTVTLDAVANDGETGENDFVAPDVENLTGGGNNDGKGHNGAVDQLDGGPDNDTLDGGPPGSWGAEFNGGYGNDTVTYAARTDNVKIYLDGSPNGEDKILNVETAYGGSGDDTIIGNDGPNAIFAKGGNDIIGGAGEKDYLYGGEGNDQLWGGGGNDSLVGSDGADTFFGGEGADWISAWNGVDTVSYDDHTVPVTVTLDGVANDGAAGEGDNVLPGAEKLIGGWAGDTLTGSDGPETLIGGLGADKLNGLGGPDLLDGREGQDTLKGGDGGDTLIGGTENDKLYGDVGIDVLRGETGNDQLDGGPDPDFADYTTAQSAVTVDLGLKTAAGGDGSDTLASIESAYGSSFDDTLTGDGGSNTILGFGGSDKLYGGGNKDHLFGADGDDLLRGGPGDDEVNGGGGSDTADYSTAPAAVKVELSFYNQSATGGDGTDWLSLIENATGSSFADNITGSSAPNVLRGGGQADMLFGLGGDDSLDGQGGTDSLDGGLDVDTCLGETLANCEK
jgi:Ca2+-binding RTX toxin-like protein